LQLRRVTGLRAERRRTTAAREIRGQDKGTIPGAGRAAVRSLCLERRDCNAFGRLGREVAPSGARLGVPEGPQRKFGKDEALHTASGCRFVPKPRDGFH